MSRSLAPALVTAADLMELDADSEPLPGDKRKGFIERYIHGEIYRARPEVMAVVHSHSASVIPFGATRTRLRPIYHMGSFLWSGAPVFDIRKVREENDLLIRDRPLGKALAGTLAKCNCVLMRGHGMTVIGDSVPEAVFRAIYTEMNARMQLQATQLEGPDRVPQRRGGQALARLRTAARSSGRGSCGKGRLAGEVGLDQLIVRQQAEVQLQALYPVGVRGNADRVIEKHHGRILDDQPLGLRQQPVLRRALRQPQRFVDGLIERRAAIVREVGGSRRSGVEKRKQEALRIGCAHIPAVKEHVAFALAHGGDDFRPARLADQFNLDPDSPQIALDGSGDLGGESQRAVVNDPEGWDRGKAVLT